MSRNDAPARKVLKKKKKDEVGFNIVSCNECVTVKKKVEKKSRVWDGRIVHTEGVGSCQSAWKSLSRNGSVNMASGQMASGLSHSAGAAITPGVTCTEWCNVSSTYCTCLGDCAAAAAEHGDGDIDIESGEEGEGGDVVAGDGDGEVC